MRLVSGCKKWYPARGYSNRSALPCLGPVLQQDMHTTFVGSVVLWFNESVHFSVEAYRVEKNGLQNMGKQDPGRAGQNR